MATTHYHLKMWGDILAPAELNSTKTLKSIRKRHNTHSNAVITECTEDWCALFAER